MHGTGWLWAGLLRAALCLCLLAAAGGARAGEVKVAVAANFMAPMQKLAAQFERETGHRAVLSFGSTGRLYAQIRNGAPFDVFLSADDETPRRLEQEAAAVPGTRWTYATGRLVLWSARPGVVDERGEVLQRADLPRLALADPKLSPYGRAAEQALQQLQLTERWRARLVQGESITQAHQFVASGNAPLGFVALSQVLEDGRIGAGSAWLVPVRLHEPLRQDGVLLLRGQHNPAALALVRHLQGDAARALIRSHGYEL